MKNEYISVSGVGSFDQRVRLTDHLVEANYNWHGPYDSPPEVFVGVQATTKTQALGVENSRGKKWHPVGDQIWPVFGTHFKDDPKYAAEKSEQERADYLKKVHNTQQLTRAVLHYSFDQQANTPQAVQVQLDSFLKRQPSMPVTSFDRKPSRRAVAGVQFNLLDWVSNDYGKTIDKALEAGGIFSQNSNMAHQGSFERIVQLGSNILDNYSPAQVANKVKEFSYWQGPHILLDSSGGSGKGFNRDKYAPFIEQLQKNDTTTGTIAVAGGLGPGELDDYAWLVERFGPLSVDAETKLRSRYDKNNPGSSYFNPKKAARFVLEADEILASAR